MSFGDVQDSFRIWLYRLSSFLKLYCLGLYYAVYELFAWRLAYLPWKSNEEMATTLLQGRIPVAVIVGGIGDIGFAIGRQLISRKWHVIILTHKNGGNDTSLQPSTTDERSRQKYLAGHREYGHLVHVIPLELSDPASIKTAVSEIKSLTTAVDLLINAAGIMYAPFSLTPFTRLESHVAVNVEGPLMLANLILQSLMLKTKKTIPMKPTTTASNGHIESERTDLIFTPKIVNVSSATLFAGSLNDPYSDHSPKTYSPHAAYANSKLALSVRTAEIYLDILHRFEEHDEIGGSGDVVRSRYPSSPPVFIVSVHPGVIPTQLYRHISTPFKWLIQNLLGCVLRTPKHAACDILHLCFREDLVGGAYYEHGQVVPIWK